MESKKPGKSFFIKFFIIFLSVMFCVYALAFVLYRRSRKIAADETLQSLTTRVTLSLRTLEREIAGIRQMQYECLNDMDLFYYVNASPIMTEFERFQALLAMKNRTDFMRNGSEYINDAAMYIPHLDWVISASRGVDHISDSWTRIVFAPADLSMAGIVFMDGKMYLRAAYPSLPVDPGAFPRHVIIIELSVPAIQDLLHSINMYDQGGSLLSSLSGDYRISAGSHRDSKNISVSSFSEYLNMTCDTYVPEGIIYSHIRWYNTFFILFSLVAVIAVAAFLCFANIIVNRPIQTLVSSLRKMEGGDFTFRIKNHASGEFDYLYRAFNNMASSLETMIEQNYRSQLLARRAELKQLQAQINPHFLYNSFFILYCMAKEEDYESITTFLSYLSDYYRYITRNVMDDVPLKDEV
jgi:two-component system sensor histidine kinase YesM